jgi:hypothetical protein
MKIPFTQLLGLAEQINFSKAFNEGRFSQADPPFADTTGFHIYSDLALPLRFSAGDGKNALLYMQILQRYAEAAAALQQSAEIVILEVQGARLHLYRDAAFTTPELLEDVIEASHAFHAMACRSISEISGDIPFNIRMAADYGRAIMLRSAGQDESESLVSLGNPANRPAKRLARDVGETGVKAGQLAINMNAVNGIESPERWEFIPLAFAEELDENLAAKQSSASSAHRRVFANSLNFSAKHFQPNPGNSVSTPVRRKGFMVRADLDGFSPIVKAAMAAGDHAIFKLVREFHEIMQFPAAYKDTLPEGVTVLLFPWAGDCANMFLECSNYSFERSYLPNTASLKWQTPERNGRDWPTIMRDRRWVVAMAGGDNENEDHGEILTGNIVVDGRTFHIGAGWSWRRSLDAEQSDGTKAQQTVIQVEDYQGLEAAHQEPYETHPASPSLFKVASLGALERTLQKEKATAAVSSPSIITGAASIILPKPRPFAE